MAPSVGSHLAPVADVFVLFYDTDAPVQQAVVFGRSRKGPMVRTTTNRDSYLEVIDYRKKLPSSGVGPVGPASAETADAATLGTGQR